MLGQYLGWQIDQKVCWARIIQRLQNIIDRKTDMKNSGQKVQDYEAARSWAQPNNAKITDHFL